MHCVHDSLWVGMSTRTQYMPIGGGPRPVILVALLVWFRAAVLLSRSRIKVGRLLTSDVFCLVLTCDEF